MKKIVITTWGSLGDLHPYLALGLELQRRGHRVVIGTGACYETKVRALGLGFHAVRPDCDWLEDPRQVQRLSHPRWGLIRVGSEMLMPALRESYADTADAAEGADLLVAMVATYAARLVAEKKQIPWVSANHIPLAFYSASDPPILDVAPRLSRRLRRCGPPLWWPLFWLGKRASRFLARPWYQLRSELGLPTTQEGNPLVDSYSPLLVLALFSKHFAEPQPDWPAHTLVSGFPFFEDDSHDTMPPSLARFLDTGPPPIVFTLGSAVSGNPGAFFRESLEAARLLNRRAVLVVGKHIPERWQSCPSDVIAVPYAPFATLFPRAAATVHHGGIGTTAMAIRAGRPMLVVPHAWDQPDNASRAVRLDVARSIISHRYRADRAAAALRRLLADTQYALHADQLGQQVRQERGTETACDALEALAMGGGVL